MYVQLPHSHTHLSSPQKENKITYVQSAKTFSTQFEILGSYDRLLFCVAWWAEHARLATMYAWSLTRASRVTLTGPRTSWHSLWLPSCMLCSLSVRKCPASTMVSAPCRLVETSSQETSSQETIDAPMYACALGMHVDRRLASVWANYASVCAHRCKLCMHVY